MNRFYTITQIYSTKLSYSGIVVFDRNRLYDEFIVQPKYAPAQLVVVDGIRVLDNMSTTRTPAVAVWL